MPEIIITGASSGIGKATAERFLDAGWTVGLIARRAERIEALAEGRENAIALPCDVTDEGAVDKAFDTFVEQAGRLDVLFNNAGRAAFGATIDEIPVALWREVVEVNLTGMFLCARAAFRIMRAQEPQGGRIINNGSISASVPRPLSAPYSSTKHGVTGLTRSIALDGRPYDIACGQIDIGNAASDITERMPKGVPQADGSTRPEPLMDVVHVANSVFYMASLPLEANVLFHTVMATKMPFVGRG